MASAGKGCASNHRASSRPGPRINSLIAACRALISVTTLGLPEGGFEVLDARVRRQLRDWYGEVVDGWELVRGYPIRHALPTQPGDVHRPSSVAPEGVTLCGDYLGNASLNAALASGGAAARSVRDRLRAN